MMTVGVPVVGDEGVRPGFKICGLTRIQDARVAVDVGARYLGAVLVPGSPRAVTVERARELAEVSAVPLAIVVADGSAAAVVDAAEVAGAGVVQLHGSESEAVVEQVRAAGPWEVWKAVRPRSVEELLVAVQRFEGLVDLLLVDAWHPERLGGTGVRVDWAELGRARDRIPDSMRLGLAGGLTPENVAQAVRATGPHLVDVSSGVEGTPGRKDPERVRAFAEAVRGRHLRMA